MAAETERQDQMIDMCKTASPVVSVIIPVYNVSSYLSQCLDSVIGQTYQHIEILVIDDGSTDDSGRICDEYARRDSRIKVLHTENRGLASARNLGLEYASGSFLSFIDSDDWIEASFMETLVQTAIETGADIVTVKRCKEYVGKTVPSQGNEAYMQMFRGQDILPAFASGLFRTEVWNKLYRISCFTDLRFPDGHNYEDVSTTWKLMKTIAGKDGLIVSLSEDLYHFRVRKTSISQTKSFRNVADLWIAHRGKYDGLTEFQKQLLPSCFSAIRDMWANYISFSREERRKAAEIIREMQSFSKAHFHQVMSGKYRWSIKMICLISQFRAPIVMWGCFCVKSLRRVIREKKCPMFD